MRERAVGPVDLAPLLEQRDDRGVLVRQQPVDRPPSGDVVEAVADPPAAPPPRAGIGQLQRPTPPPVVPAVGQDPVDHARRDRQLVELDGDEVQLDFTVPVNTSARAPGPVPRSARAGSGRPTARVSSGARTATRSSVAGCGAYRFSSTAERSRLCPLLLVRLAKSLRTRERRPG